MIPSDEQVDLAIAAFDGAWRKRPDITVKNFAEARRDAMRAALQTTLSCLKPPRTSPMQALAELNEDHPVLAAILRVRHRNACNFAPSHSGALGEARDETLLEVYREVKNAIAALQTDGMVMVPKEDQNAGR